MKPIVWTDIDLRKRFRRDHEMDLMLVRQARERGRLDRVQFHLSMAAFHRGRLADTLRTYRFNDVRFFDPVAFVNGGGFNLEETASGRE